MDSTSGFAKNMMSFGKTSGTPPTAVATTRHPHDAASRMAMQNDSVSDALRKMSPRRNTSGTSSCGTCPSTTTRSVKPASEMDFSRCFRIDPSPAMMKSKSSYLAHASGMTPAKRCTPFLYISLDVITTVTRPSLRRVTSGLNLLASTAFGMTLTRSGANPGSPPRRYPLRKIVFSFAVCETQIAWCVSASVMSNSLFV